MIEHFTDLRVAALTRNPCHEPRERIRITNPLAGTGFAESAKIDQLYIEPANFLYGLEHVGLEPKRKVPGRLSAHGCVHCEDKPSPASGANRSDGSHASKEGVDLSATGASGLNRGIFFLHRRF